MSRRGTTEEKTAKSDPIYRSRLVNMLNHIIFYANRRLLLNSPDPTVPVWGTSSAKVTEWG